MATISTVSGSVESPFGFVRYPPFQRPPFIPPECRPRTPSAPVRTNAVDGTQVIGAKGGEVSNDVRTIIVETDAGEGPATVTIGDFVHSAPVLSTRRLDIRNNGDADLIVIPPEGGSIEGLPELPVPAGESRQITSRPVEAEGEVLEYVLIVGV